MTAVSIHRPRRRTASCMNANEPEDALLENDLLSESDSEEGERVVKLKKKRKKDKRKKKYSSSGGESNSVEQRHRGHGKRRRSKRKRRNDDEDDDATGGRINPIFLWVKENNAKIVQVMCEDYDKRNRIKLTKTANGWISVPHIEGDWSRPAVEATPPSTSSEPEETAQCRDDDHIMALKGETDNQLIPVKSEKEEDDHREELPTNDRVVRSSPEADPEIIPPELNCTPLPESIKDPESLEPPKLCCSDLTSSTVNLDENHNNEMNPSVILSSSLTENQSNELSDHLLDTCVPDVDVDSFCNDDHDCVVKGIIDELESSINSSDDAYENSPDPTEKPEPVEFSQHSLMEELEEICHDIMNEELKVDKTDSKELFAFGEIHSSPPATKTSPDPDPETENSRVSHQEIPDGVNTEIKPTDEPTPSPKNSPMNLVIDNKVKPKEDTCLTENDLDTLDILWRLPEGTTIHQSKQDIVPPKCKQSSSPSPVPSKPFEQVSILPRLDPVQEEPLNLGKPKIDIRPDKFFFKKDLTPDPVKHTKSRPKTVDHCPEIPAEPLTQLKELMADPEMSVPDPLLVPKARLPALIANPKQEIPRLLALNNEIKYSRLEADLLEVSLAHLQLLVQSGSKVDDLKISQNNAAQVLQTNNTSCLDPATMNALNQMLWLPYLTQLDVPRQNNAQDLIGMMNMVSYPYNWNQKAFDCLPSQPQQSLLPSWEDILHRPPNFSTFPPSAPRLYGDAPKNPLPPRNTFGSLPRSRDSSSRVQSSHRRSRPQPPSLPPPPPPQSRPYQNTGIQDFSRIPQPKTHHQSLIPPPIPHSSWPQSFNQQRGPITHPDVYRVPPTTANPGPPPVATTLPWAHEVDPVTTSSSSNKPPPASTPSKASLAGGEALPKLKVRKFDFDPNSIPKLLNLDRNKYIPSNSSLPLDPGLGHHMNLHQHPMYNGNHLWHPLYAGPEEKKQEYVSPWNWTTPVTVSGK